MSFLGDLFNILTGLDEVLNSIDAIAQDGETLVQHVAEEIQKIRNFKHDPKWKTRVVLVPQAIKRSKETVVTLAQELYDALHVLVSNLKALRATHLHGSEKAGVATVLGLVTKVREFVGLIDDTIKNLDQFVQALRKVTEELQTFDSIFLQQGNSRRRLTDEAFAVKSPFERIGALHS